MKLSRFYHQILLSGVVFALLAAPTLARPVGKVRSVQPLVEAHRGTEAWQPIKERFSLQAGQVIRSGAKGKATLTFNDGTEVVLNSKAQVAIEGEGSSTQPLALRVAGSLAMIFVRAKGPMEIRTAAGVAAVTGTEYIISLLDDDTTQLTVIEGGVRLYNAQGSVLVGANQQSTAKVGQKPTTPVAVDTSGLMQWTFDVAGLPVEFEMPMNSGPAMKSLAAGDFATAETQLTEAVKLAPADAALLTALGNVRRQRGDANGAIDAFDQAAKLAPADAAPRIGLALSQLSKGDINAARGALQNAPDAALTHAARGLVALRANDTATASQELETAIQRDPQAFQAHALLALTRLSQNQNAQAVSSGRRAVEIAPQSAQAQASLALALFYSGQTAGAAQAATRAVRLNPNSPFALLAQGEALLARHDSDGAKQAFMQAEAVAPNLPLIHLDLGAAYTRLDMPVRAEKAYRRALQMVPNSATAHSGLGAVLQATGHSDAALPELQRAVELEPDNAFARGNLAAYYIEMGDFDKAETVAAKVADDPSNGLLYIRLSEANLFKQRLFAAQEFALKAVRLLPASAQAHYQLGRVYRELDRTVQAEQEFRLAVVLDPQFAAARFALGLAREAAASSTNFSRPLSAIASNSSGPRQALNIQNLQTPGVEERIQAAIQDPSVVRNASRSFGDTQLEGSIGENGVSNFDLSHLRDINDRRGALGAAASRFHTDGVRSDADLTQEKFGFNWGSKQQDGASGFFALGQFERDRFGNNTGPTPTTANGTLRFNKQLPLALVGFNHQTSERQRTRGLLQFDRPTQDGANAVSFLNTKGRSFHGEVRHDLLLNEKHTLSAGASLGNRRFDLDALFKTPPGLPFPDFRSMSAQRLQPAKIYLRDEVRLSPRLTVMAEMKVERLESQVNSVVVSPPGIAPSLTSATTTAGVPSVVATYQLTPASTLRLRARGLFGTVEDFGLLSPTDVFLYSLNNVPTLSLAARGRSYEAEFNHTFKNASFLRIGAFQQNLNAAAGSSEVFTDVRFRALRARYEGVLNNSTTFFASTDLNDAKGTNDLTGLGGIVDTNYRLTRVPKFAAEAGVQFLNRSGWFVQPSAAYIGSRLQEFDGTSRARLGGFTLVNLRAGKRSGLRTTVFVEVTNLFDKSYLGSAGFLGELEPGRQFRIGAAHRF